MGPSALGSTTVWVEDPSVQAPWEILELAEGATLAELKAAHRRLSRRYHPDLHADASPEVRAAATRHMEQVNAAYTALLPLVHDEPAAEPGTSLVPRRRTTPWDDALASGPTLGRQADVAA